MAITKQVTDAIVALERDGRLSARSVLNAAMDKNSPLHSYFEWDDTAAAVKYRLEQARELIRKIKVEVTVLDRPITVVSYVHDPDAPSGEGGYRSIRSLMTEEDSARAVVLDEMRRVVGAVSRAKRIATVLGLIDTLDQIDGLADSLVRRITLDDKGEGTAPS